MFKAKNKARICIESKPSNNTQIGIDTFELIQKTF